MSKTTKAPLKVGDSYTFIKTLSESDVYLLRALREIFLRCTPTSSS